MYGPYRHRGHVGALDHANIAVNNRPGIQRDSLTFYTLRGKVRRPPHLHQCTLPTLRNKCYKEQKSPKHQIFYAYYNHQTKSVQNAAPSPMYSPDILELIM